MTRPKRTRKPGDDRPTAQSNIRLTLRVADHTYVFRYDPRATRGGDLCELVRRLHSLADDTRHPFNWYHAGLISRAITRIRQAYDRAERQEARLHR